MFFILSCSRNKASARGPKSGACPIMICMRMAAVASLLVVTLACSTSKRKEDFAAVAGDFVYKSLAFSPVTASAQGLHKYNGQDFDGALDDMSATSIQAQRQYYSDLHKRLEEFDKKTLSAEDRADYDIVDTAAGLALFDIDIAQSWRRSPQSYVELIGSALFNPYVLEYAPKAERFEHIIARLQLIPRFMDVARRQLRGVPAVWAAVAKEENDGNIDLVDKTLRAAVPPARKAAYEAAAEPALDALRGFSRYLDKELPERAGGKADWRLGAANYAIKFKLALDTSSPPDRILAEAQNRMGEVRAQMLRLALPLHAAWFSGHGDHADRQVPERENAVIREVLDHIAAEHSTPAGYLDDARKDLDEASSFVRANNLLSLPAGDNLQVIPTPEFERGIYAVGGFNPAPALEPRLGAFFWITPIAADWPQARVESKLREYNTWNLKLLTLHEAMPGHYVQGEFANAVQPASRRILRAVYANGPYVEGWAQYATQMMIEQGFLNHSTELQLTFLKQELRVDANAVIDIRMQTSRMTDEEAMAMMENSTFQEHEEAVAKLQRVKLSSTQLATYFVGWRDWLRLREAMERQGNRGPKPFNLRDFHDSTLKEGALPLPVLVKLLTGNDF